MIRGGGASRDRTDDLFHAMEALSQLSYGPVQGPVSEGNYTGHAECGRRFPVLPRVARIPEIHRQESDSETHYSIAKSAAASFSATVCVLRRMRLAVNDFIMSRYR
jgi:hypothetical protein